MTLVRCVPVPATLVSLMPKRDTDPVDPGSTIYDDIDAILADNEVDEAEIRGLAQAWEVADRWSEALLRADRRS